MRWGGYSGISGWATVIRRVLTRGRQEVTQLEAEHGLEGYGHRPGPPALSEAGEGKETNAPQSVRKEPALPR